MSEHAIENAKAWLETIKELAGRMDAEDDDTREAAEEEAQESVLSVMVRDGWRSPGGSAEDGAEEYEVLLTTGGPALRLWGKLGRSGPDEWPHLQWQDWGTPWMEVPLGEEREAVSTFLSAFYFEE